MISTGFPASLDRASAVPSLSVEERECNDMNGRFATSYIIRYSIVIEYVMYCSLQYLCVT